MSKNHLEQTKKKPIKVILKTNATVSIFFYFEIICFLEDAQTPSDQKQDVNKKTFEFPKKLPTDQNNHTQNNPRVNIFITAFRIGVSVVAVALLAIIVLIAVCLIKRRNKDQDAQPNGSEAQYEFKDAGYIESYIQPENS